MDDRALHHRDTGIGLAPGVTREFLMHHRLCPSARDATGRLIVATAPDAMRGGLPELSYAYGCETVARPCSEDEVNRLIERVSSAMVREVDMTAVDGTDDDTTDLRELANQPPVVRYVNLLVRDAYDAQASDIHLEASREGLTVRFRLDGVLTVVPEPPASMVKAVVSRLKLLAELDVAEHRRPQDGRVRVRMEDACEMDLRISTVPTMFGESVVVRLLDHGGQPATLEELGFDAGQLTEMDRICRRPHGLVLVTGPTGSGKTTTLHAALRRRDLRSEKVVTVEDPVEYQLPGIAQVPVQRKAGVTFGSALRSILRQDPDVVMVGEMRDPETAQMAVQAAMTGHLVFSTLHTNDALGAIPRLIDLDVPDYLIGATLEAVLAQRLVRRTCTECQVEYTPPSQHVALISGRPAGQPRFFRGAGCPKCRGTGYRGRIALFELLRVDEEIREAIAAAASRRSLRALFEDNGAATLRADGWAKVQRGLTTVEEVLRVAQ